MVQYNTIKVKYPGTLLLFRVGDFYETFGKDAIKASEILDIVLTARNNGESKIELAGFPYHSLDTYLPKLVRAGLRVAICDQLENPKDVKGIVKRGVTELVQNYSLSLLASDADINDVVTMKVYGGVNELGINKSYSAITTLLVSVSMHP